MLPRQERHISHDEFSQYELPLLNAITENKAVMYITGNWKDMRLVYLAVAESRPQCDVEKLGLDSPLIVNNNLHSTGCFRFYLRSISIQPAIPKILKFKTFLRMFFGASS
jgi:hypothetical protein